MRFISGAGVAIAALLVSALAVPVQAEAPASERATARAAVKTVSEVHVFGTSVKGRALRAYRIGDPTSDNKVVLIATMHGDETGPSKILLNLMHGPPVTGADIWVIPYLNRDGMARHTRTNAHGVDLNRNYPVGWIRQKGKYNSGKKPASEPETRALMRFLGTVRPDYVVSMHQPLYGVDASYGKARAFALRLVKGLKLPKTVFNCNGGCHGTMTQWFNKVYPGQALTVEYGRAVTRHQATVTGPTGLLSSVYADR